MRIAVNPVDDAADPAAELRRLALGQLRERLRGDTRQVPGDLPADRPDPQHDPVVERETGLPPEILDRKDKTAFAVPEARWIRDTSYLNQYIHLWFRGNEGKPLKKLRAYSGWNADAIYNRYMVDFDKKYLLDMLPDLTADFAGWEAEKRHANGLFWQFDVRDGMEETGLCQNCSSAQFCRNRSRYCPFIGRCGRDRWLPRWHRSSSAGLQGPCRNSDRGSCRKY